MPTNACLFFYDCTGCGVRLKPKPGDCRVFCSYGSVPCPPIQTGATCGAEERNSRLNRLAIKGAALFSRKREAEKMAAENEYAPARQDDSGRETNARA